MRIVVSEAPTDEPLTLDEVKAHCRIDIDTDDDLLTSLITASRQFVEQYIGSGLLEQTQVIYYDFCENPFAKSVVNLPIKSILTIESITSYDSTNDDTVIDDANYFLSGNRVVFNDTFNAPSSLRQHDCVAVEVTVGFGDAAEDVPQAIKQAMLMLIAHWYENRETVFDPMSNAPNRTMMPYGVTALLQPYRTFTI